LKIRVARRSDKEIILQFCTNTFSWGDYIDKVFDIWYAEPYGRLLVADTGGNIRNKDEQYKAATAIAVSHVVLCPDKKRIWIEGIRVHPSYRRHRVATALIGKMLQYGKQKGAKETSAIISSRNIASQSLFKNNGFEIVSKWRYYKIPLCNKINEVRNSKINTRIASLKDIDDIWNYLRFSEIYRLSGKLYFNAWRWYPLNYKTILDFIKKQRLIVTENNRSTIKGVAIVNREGYWNRTNIFQIVYLDSTSLFSLQNLISFCTKICFTSTYNNERHKFDQLQILSYQNKQLLVIMSNITVKESEQFFLYSRHL
jgi:GNAT superfamily N-acetyltransferase